MSGFLPGTKDVEVIRELAPLREEPVLGNFTFSMLSNSNLEKLLRDSRIETLVLAVVVT